MKNIKTAKALSEIDEEYIIEALPEERIKVTVFPWKYLALASSFALIVCLGVMAVLFSSGVQSDKSKTNSSTSAADDTGYEKRIIKADDSSFADIAKEKSWEEKNNSERFSEMGGLQKFVSTNTLVPADRINFSPMYGVLNPYAEARTTDPLTNKTYTIECIEYAIKGININYAMAVKFKGEEVYYAYVNTEFIPHTFKEFAESLDLENNISFGSAYYTLNDGREIEFEGIDKKKVWDILFSDTSSMTALSDPNDILAKGGFTKRVSISTNMDVLGYKNITMSFSDDGLLFTNLLGTAKIFRIDTKNVQRLKSYLTSSCKGYELVYENKQGEIVSKPSDDSSSVSKNLDLNDVSKRFTVFNMNSNVLINGGNDPIYRATGSTVTREELDNKDDSDMLYPNIYTEEFFKNNYGKEIFYNFEYGKDSISSRIAKIKNVSTKCAYAVQYQNRTGIVIDDRWYVFTSEDFSPSTLYEYANDIGMKYYATYTSKSQKPLAADKVWDVIFDDGEKNVIESDTSKYDDSKKLAEINVDISVLGCKGKSIKVSENGYLYTDVFGKPKVFNIGREKAQKIADYLNK